MITEKHLRDEIAILEHAKLVIAGLGWTQCTAARDKAGHPVQSRDNDAASFCATGALERAYVKLHADSVYLYGRTEASVYRHIHEFLPQEHRGDVVGFNDSATTKREDVVALFDKAIVHAKWELRNLTDSSIASNTCGYCGHPYTIAAGGCEAKCNSSQAAARMIADAAKADVTEQDEVDRR